MLFHWQSRHRGACVVNSACAAHGVCVIIAWGTEHDGDSVEYRIENVTGAGHALCDGTFRLVERTLFRLAEPGH